MIHWIDFSFLSDPSLSNSDVIEFWHHYCFLGLTVCFSFPPFNSALKHHKYHITVQVHEINQKLINSCHHRVSVNITVTELIKTSKCKILLRSQQTHYKIFYLLIQIPGKWSVKLLLYAITCLNEIRLLLHFSAGSNSSTTLLSKTIWSSTGICCSDRVVSLILKASKMF